MAEPSLMQWERLKRLTFVVDGHVETGRVSTGKPTHEIDELYRLAREMGVLSGLPAAEQAVGKVVDGSLQRFLRHAYAFHLTSDGWPTRFSVKPDGKVRVGIAVRSLDGRLEGRTTGGRRRCPSHQCDGWLLGVHWQTGQRLHICTEGWHYDPETDEIRVIGGGAISARFVSPKPLGTPPAERSEWPSRQELLKTRAWSVREPR